MRSLEHKYFFMFPTCLDANMYNVPLYDQHRIPMFPNVCKECRVCHSTNQFSKPQSNLSPHLPKISASVIIFLCSWNTHIPGNYFFLFCRLILTSTNIYNDILRNALWLGSITVRHIMYLHKLQSGSLCMASWFCKMKYMRLYKHNIALILSRLFSSSRTGLTAQY